ncbi:unnamed protein product [Clonostachys byssicola]|uniref:Uncharacterized protein n=1 Tax=Clonostachys byssicola TaxID=160290 RepID=A0A9N9XXZ2_9HYPO|nr:unnamed protein product [Clonostachys byssicola]
MSVSKDDGTPSPVDVASSIGTWLAAGVAIVALLGVIAPFLAIQSSMSDRNRALNAVQDLPQKYISQGYHLWTGYRAFRWAKLSELLQAYTISVETSRDPIELGITQGGTLEVVNSRTALVVNKYWILQLGILGRYGR